MAKSTDNNTLAPSAIDPNAFASILAEYGVTQDTITIPEPPTAIASGLEPLCEYKTPIYDARKNLIPDVLGHTGPMMFLAKEGETDSEKYTGYDGFYKYAILHPVKGKLIVTLSRPSGEGKPTLVKFWDSLTPGSMVQVANIKTSSGFHTFNPVPVQAAS